VNDPNGNSFNNYLRMQQGAHNNDMHQIPDMTVASGPSFDHTAMAAPVQDRYAPAHNNFGNWTVSPTNVSPTSGVSASSQPLYGIPQHQGMHAQAQAHLNPGMQNGYDPAVYLSGNGQVYYPQQQPAQQFVSQLPQNGWSTRSGPHGVLYEQDGTQVVYNDSDWNVFMSNLGMDMGA